MSTSERALRSSLSANQCSAVFGFFANAHRTNAISASELNSLRGLPIFETKQGSCVAIDEGNFFLCPTNVPLHVEDQRLLKLQEKRFYEALGVEELDDAALFEMFVLPKFHTFDLSRRRAALEQLRCNWPKVAQS
eukprot:762970-Hanusia_phi.AAC.4